MKHLLCLVFLAGTGSLASAMPIPGTEERSDFDEVVSCVRHAKSKRLVHEREFNGSHRFFFNSMRSSGNSSVDVTIPRSDSMPVQVRGLGEWLGPDERLAREVATCADEKLVVLRGRRQLGFDEGNRRHMPAEALQLQSRASYPAN